MQKQSISLYVVAMMAAQVCLTAKAEPDDFQARGVHSLRSHDYDVKHYRIDLTLDEDTKSFAGITQVDFTSSQEGLNNLKLDAETFVVNTVIDENGKALAFKQSDGKLDITLKAALQKGAESKVIIHYQADNVDIDPTKFGMKAGYDLGLDFKAASDTNPQLINTLSFPEGARHWFPCFDHPSDWATHDTLITVKNSYKAIANGALLSTTENVDTGMRTYYYSQLKPQPTYLYVLVAGPYVVLEDKHGELPLQYWVYSGKEKDAQLTFAPTANMIGFFEKLYGSKFPWVKYAQITVPGIGGGAESTSATVLGESLVRNQQDIVDFPSNRVISHEIAHQWWGDFVGYQDWQHVWLSESFATLSEYLFNAQDLGKDEGALNLFNKKRDYLNEAHNKFIRPIVTNKWDRPDQMFDNHSYAKGAVVLNMFRDLVGVESFSAIMQGFLQKHAYSNATTEDFFDIVSAVSGKDYQWFFEQWLLKPGHPVLEITSDWDEKQSVLVLNIKQTQDTNKGIALFKLPIRIGITTESGKRVQDIWLDKQQQTFSFALAEKPLLVHFDEGDVLLKEWTFNKSTGELLYQLSHDNAMGRLWAATELETHLNEAEVTNALIQAVSKDNFWAVRQTALTSLSKVQSVELQDYLQQLSIKDVKNQVRATALNALGAYKNPQLIGFIKQRYATEQSYLLKAAAISALGQYHDPTLTEFISQAALISSPRDVVAKAAKAALADNQ
jgi:aminopeptidase N